MIIDTSRVSSSVSRSYQKKETYRTRYENTITKAGTTSDSDFISAYLNQGNTPASSASEADASDNSSASEASASTNSSANNSPATEGATDSASSPAKAGDKASTASSLYDLYRANVKTYKTDTLYESQLDAVNKVRNELFSYLMKLLFGDDWESTYNDYMGGSSAENTVSSPTYTYGVSTSTYTTDYEYSESEALNYSTTGTVTTSDGRSIDFNVNLSLSRSFVAATSTSVDYSQPILIDPIVLNLDIPSAGLGDQTFSFDLDSDGDTEEISFPGEGSAFLALDQNENGSIDDGSELFGAQSGNGFADLSAYDEDGNGWIDEADSVFARLKVWYKNEDGTDCLLSIKDAGVGAICLGSEEGDFSLTDSAGRTEAVIRRHGIFLYEDGNVGTVQQLDLAT